MKVSVTLTVNSETIEVQVEPRTNLADLLREQLRLTATHLGCEHGVCGACTVLIDGEPARSCLVLVASLDSADVCTLEGMAADPIMQVIKHAFHQEHGLQCGFCTPGMLISSWDLLKRNPKRDAQEVRVAMSGNLCRCTGYQGIVRSIVRAGEELSSGVGAERSEVARAASPLKRVT